MPAAKKVVRRRRGRLDRAAQKTREKAIIADLKAGLLSYRKIAEKHGVSLPTVNAKARKAGVRRPRGRRPLAATLAAAAAAPKRPGRPRKVQAAPAKAAKVARPRRRRPGRPRRVGAGGGGFADAFREMVLRYYPSLTLAKFDRLAKLVARTVA